MILAYLSTADRAVAYSLLLAAAVLSLWGLFRSTYSTRLTDEQRAMERRANALAALERITEPKESIR